MDNEGNLIIPDDAAIARACPVTLPAEAGPQIEAWRKTFPQAQAQAGAGSTGTDSEGAKKGGDPPPPPLNNVQAGTVMDTLEALQNAGEEIVKEVTFPEGSPPIFDNMRLALGKNPR